MDEPKKQKRSNFEAAGIAVFIFIIAIIGLVLLIEFVSHRKSVPTQTQSGCITTAQAQIDANPGYYNTVPVGTNPAGLTLSGQIALNTAINSCKSQYPVK